MAGARGLTQDQCKETQPWNSGIMDLCGTFTMALWDGVMGLMQRPSINATVISGVLDQRNKKMCHSGDFTIPKINLGTNTPIKGPASLFLGLVANRILQRSGTGQRQCCFSWAIHRVNKSLTPAVTLGREITARVQLVR